MKINIKEIAVFGMLGAIMYASKVLMDLLPNIHLLGVLTVAITVVYRKKALYPIYTYVLLCGLLSGFAMWWIPHLYLWAILWGATMLIPQTMSKKAQALAYMCVCAAHGFLYGILYAPSQALMFGYTFEQTLTWIAVGLPWDLIHGVSNFVGGLLIMPLSNVLRRAKNLA